MFNDVNSFLEGQSTWCNRSEGNMSRRGEMLTINHRSTRLPKNGKIRKRFTIALSAFSLASLLSLRNFRQNAFYCIDSVGAFELLSFNLSMLLHLCLNPPFIYVCKKKYIKVDIRDCPIETLLKCDRVKNGLTLI